MFNTDRLRIDESDSIPAERVHVFIQHILHMFYQINISIYFFFLHSLCNIWPSTSLFESFIRDWFKQSVSHLLLISLATSPVLQPSHWASAVHIPRVLIIRGRPLIFVIHSGCRCPACTLALIENLQMRPVDLVCSVRSCWPSSPVGCQSWE